MSRVEYLNEQVARAERLALPGLDTVTIERLRAFAAECRAELNGLTGSPRSAESCRGRPFAAPVPT